MVSDYNGGLSHLTIAVAHKGGDECFSIVLIGPFVLGNGL